LSVSARALNQRELFYERFSGEFDSAMNRYEVEKRLALVFDNALGKVDLDRRRFLDAGCGTGLFSQAAKARGAEVTAMDVGPNLLARVQEKCRCETAVGDVLALPFPDARFDVVLCTEVIEHTPRPQTAIDELARVLRPGGTLVLTTPNRVWHPLIRLANVLKIRPYEGLENWVRWRELRSWIAASGLEIVDQSGFNALPFIHPLTYPLIDRLDHLGHTSLGRLMINMMFVAAKPAARVSPA
jgi:2-polyprenyl-6-hydroxyphenyl methylase / 3-demethylubiquinone-9 3-methyltransferase